MSETQETRLPFTEEAERAVISCILNDGKQLATVMDILSPDDFYRKSHRVTFAAMQHLHQEGHPVDPISVTARLRHTGEVHEVGGIEGLLSISDEFFVSSSLPYHASIVRRDSLRRQLFRGSREIAKSTLDNDELDPSLAVASGVLAKLNDLNTDPQPSDIWHLVNNVFDIVNDRYLHPEQVHGVATGFVDLDDITGGFRGGELIIVAARPAMGKTQFALNLAYNAASGKRTLGNKQKRVAFFSLEMTKEQVTERLLAIASGLYSQSLRKGQLTDDQWKVFTNAGVELQELPLDVFDATHNVQTVRHIEAKVRRKELAGEKPDIIIVDYISYLSGDRAENRQLEVESIAKDLHRLAKLLGIPIICLCQLSRKVEERQNKRPMLSDLRDSGGVEQVADTVAFLYRDEYYNEESEKRGTCEVILAKQRHGPLGTVELAFQIDTGRFFDPEEGVRFIGKEPPRYKRYRGHFVHQGEN